MRNWWAAISLRGLRVQILLWTILPLIFLLIAFSLTGIRSHQQSMRTMVAERDASDESSPHHSGKSLNCFF